MARPAATRAVEQYEKTITNYQNLPTRLHTADEQCKAFIGRANDEYKAGEEVRNPNKQFTCFIGARCVRAFLQRTKPGRNSFCRKEACIFPIWVTQSGGHLRNNKAQSFELG
jgi:hypothetical protein